MKKAFLRRLTSAQKSIPAENTVSAGAGLIVVFYPRYFSCGRMSSAVSLRSAVAECF
jgi:hypothetical protein